MNDESEKNCLIVCSRGIVKMCERHNNFLSSSTRQIDEEIFIDLKDYTVVHLCSWLSISIFATKYAPNIKNKIILVTNDSDFDAPVFDKPVGKGDEINKEGILNFLNSDYCVVWFTQNCTLNHPKVVPIPIGMDYHTFSRQLSPVRQEQILIDIKQNSRPFYERIVQCYGNFHFSMDNKYYTSDRYDCLNSVKSSLTYYEKVQIQRTETWENQRLFAFVLSPAGGGLDCHRTWEAIALGCIPIVKRWNLPIDTVYDDLPVLIVNEWSDITEELLISTINYFKGKKFNYNKLFLNYWVKLIYSYKK
jgi:hypothetical protein